MRGFTLGLLAVIYIFIAPPPEMIDSYLGLPLPRALAPAESLETTNQSYPGS